MAILLPGIPKGIIDGFQNFTGSTPADLLRLNVAIKPTTSGPNVLGIIGKDLAGFPNGRRVFDDTVTIELRAIAGATIPLVDHGFTPDGAAARSQTSSLGRSPACWPNDTSKPFPISGFRWTVSTFLLREPQADGTALGCSSTCLSGANPINSRG